MAFEAQHYEETRQRLMSDPTVRDMVEGLRSVPRDQLAHPNGTPRFEFMQAANREYHKRTGQSAGAHIGGVAEAILRLLGDAT